MHIKKDLLEVTMDTNKQETSKDLDSQKQKEVPLLVLKIVIDCVEPIYDYGDDDYDLVVKGEVLIGEEPKDFSAHFHVSFYQVDFFLNRVYGCKNYLDCINEDSLTGSEQEIIGSVCGYYLNAHKNEFIDLATKFKNEYGDPYPDDDYEPPIDYGEYQDELGLQAAMEGWDDDELEFWRLMELADDYCPDEPDGEEEEMPEPEDWEIEMYQSQAGDDANLSNSDDDIPF